MKSPPPLTISLAERRWKSYSGVLLSVIGRLLSLDATHVSYTAAPPPGSLTRAPQPRRSRLRLCARLAIACWVRSQCSTPGIVGHSVLLDRDIHHSVWLAEKKTFRASATAPGASSIARCAASGILCSREPGIVAWSCSPFSGDIHLSFSPHRIRTGRSI